MSGKTKNGTYLLCLLIVQKFPFLRSNFSNSLYFVLFRFISIQFLPEKTNRQKEVSRKSKQQRDKLLNESILPLIKKAKMAIDLEISKSIYTFVSIGVFMHIYVDIVIGSLINLIIFSLVRIIICW